MVVQPTCDHDGRPCLAQDDDIHRSKGPQAAVYLLLPRSKSRPMRVARQLRSDAQAQTAHAPIVYACRVCSGVPTQQMNGSTVSPLSFSLCFARAVSQRAQHPSIANLYSEDTCTGHASQVRAACLLEESIWF